MPIPAGFFDAMTVKHMKGTLHHQCGWCAGPRRGGGGEGYKGKISKAVCVD